MGIASCFKRGIFGRTSFRALLPLAFRGVHASARNGDLRPTAALFGTFAALLFSAVCVCVFGRCRLYSYYGVLDCTMNKCHIRLHLLLCVPLISLSLVSALGPVLAGPWPAVVIRDCLSPSVCCLWCGVQTWVHAMLWVMTVRGLRFLASRRFSLQCSRRSLSLFAYGWNSVVSMSGVVFMPRLARDHSGFAVCGAELLEAALVSAKTTEGYCAQCHDRGGRRSNPAGIALATPPKFACT